MTDTAPAPHARFDGGDASASVLGPLMARHERDVRSALRRVLGRCADEDDLVQEVFVRLMVRLRQPGELSVGAWVRSVARNLAVDEIRRRRPIPVEEIHLDRAVGSPVDDSLDGVELYSHVVRGARSLPDRQRTALAAALTGGGVAGVAATLNLSVPAAESLLRRARSGLRDHLAGVGADSGKAGVGLGAVVAAAGAALAWLVRPWRAVVVAGAVGAGAVTAVAIVPSLPAGAPPSARPSAVLLAGHPAPEGPEAAGPPQAAGAGGREAVVGAGGRAPAEVKADRIPSPPPAPGFTVPALPVGPEAAAALVAAVPAGLVEAVAEVPCTAESPDVATGAGAGLVGAAPASLPEPGAVACSGPLALPTP